MTTELRGGAGAALLLAALAAAAAPLEAATITLETRAGCRPVEGGGRCVVEIENLGDAAARDLEVRLELGDSAFGTERRALLEAGASWETAVELPAAAAATAGRHAVPIEVRYHDADGYPFAALAHAHLVLGEATPPSLDGTLESLELSRGPAAARWRLRNGGPETVEARIRLLLPGNLHGDTEPRDIRLAPGEVSEGSFSVENFSAFPGSAYRIYALVEGDGGALFLPATARVLAPPRPTEAARLPLTLLAGLLAGIWLTAGRSARRGGAAPVGAHGSEGR